MTVGPRGEHALARALGNNAHLFAALIALSVARPGRYTGRWRILLEAVVASRLSFTPSLLLRTEGFALFDHLGSEGFDLVVR